MPYSAETGEHVDEIRSLLKDKITVLSGLSGVGKSSLVNCIEPGLDLKTCRRFRMPTIRGSIPPLLLKCFH